jgi:diguanylate cyclase (GGDEF)-like protein
VGDTRRRPSVVVGLAGAVFALFVSWQIFRWGGARHRTAIGDLFPIPLDIAATVLAIVAARAAGAAGGEHTTRRAWRLIAASFASYLAGDIIWATLEVVKNTSPFPSAADGFYLCFYPLFAAGLLSFPGQRRTRAEHVRLGLDVATIVLATTIVVWYFALGDTIKVGGTSLSHALSVAYPAGDLVLIFGVVTVVMRGVRSTDGGALRLLALGVGAFVIADIGFAHLQLSNSYASGDWPDTFWMLAWVGLVAGADRRRRTHAPVAGERPHAEPHLRPARLTALPYLAVGGSYVLLMIVARHHLTEPLNGMIVGAFTLTALVVMRQLASQQDNLRLARDFERLATTDDLTGLVNRRHFLELAERELERFQQSDGELTIMMIDVDHFKAINDTFGHETGDSTLQWLASRCHVVLRRSDIISRYGGDELVVLLPDTALETASTAAQRLEADVDSADARPVGRTFSLSLSIGVASAKGCADLRTLLRRADEALYHAKRAGRGRVHTSEPVVSDPVVV